MEKIVLYSHGGSGNRGCEAIVRGTYKMMERELSDAPMFLCSLNKDEDEEVKLPEKLEIIPYSNYVRRHSVEHLIAACKNRLFRDTSSYVTLAQRNLYKQFGNHTLAISIGGDNYCYTDSKWLYLSHKKAKERKTKTVLWGCSLEADNMDEEMIADLSQYDLIVARESLTYDLLLNKGIAKNTKLYPDPAFLLDSKKVELPPSFVPGNTIGMNLSPYIFRSDLPKEQVLDVYAAFIERVLQTTDFHIAFIPHVFWRDSNDVEVMNAVYERVRGRGRITNITDKYNCMEMKYVISQCRMFIGARTHSTIAAYSTCVPTLVLGYSVKSRGIARDIFGSEKHMVIPVQSIRDPQDLMQAFQYIETHEERLRHDLRQMMPDYKDRAGQACSEIGKLLKGS